MYVVVSFEDKIAIQPDKFGREQADVLVDEIEHKHCNKVVLGWVCVCHLFTILWRLVFLISIPVRAVRTSWSSLGW